jgi:hypothetical protein
MGNRDQHADRLHQQTRPLNEINLRSTDNDALPARVEGIFKRSGDFLLCRFLASRAERQGKDCFQRFGKRPRSYPQMGFPLSHLRPFLGDGLVDVVVDQAAHPRFGVAGKAGSHEQHDAQRTGLAVERASKPMIDDPDIFRAGKLLIGQHGEDAPLRAAQRADELLKDGDIDGSAVWGRILTGVKELRRGRREGEPLN